MPTTQTRPSTNKGGKPKGDAPKSKPNDDAATKRGIEKQNESAEILANEGYDIWHNKTALPNGKKPDYKIEEEYFDCYAPEAYTNVRNIGSNIEDKVIAEQADRIILNLDDNVSSVTDIQKQLNDWPIERLNEVIGIKNGQVIHIFP
jgi:hypothetical protein